MYNYLSSYVFLSIELFHTARVSLTGSCHFELLGWKAAVMNNKALKHILKLGLDSILK